MCDKKQIDNNPEVIVNGDIPVIKDVYDPLTGLRDGTITPNAPIVVTGENLCLSLPENMVLGLSPAENSEQLIRIKTVCKHTDTQVLIVLPDLLPGTYHPVMEIRMEGKVCSTYILPVLWTVRDAGNSVYLLRRDRSILI